MKNYLVYEKDPGPFIKKISASNEGQLLRNVAKSEKWIECSSGPRNCYIKNGKAVYYPKKPSYPCEFDYNEEEWVSDKEKCWAVLREERDRLLSQCDWTQIPDAPVDKSSWADYRQKLRDLPQNTIDPVDVDWPSKPK